MVKILISDLRLKQLKSEFFFDFSSNDYYLRSFFSTKNETFVGKWKHFKIAKFKRLPVQTRSRVRVHDSDW